MWEAIRANPSLVPFGLAGLMLLLLFLSLRSGALQVGRIVDQRIADKDEIIATKTQENTTLRQIINVKDGQIESLSVVNEFQQRAWSAIERIVERAEREERR